ncbi:MAG: TspO/MBR family protein [Chroococcales cyanobacterium]
MIDSWIVIGLVTFVVAMGANLVSKQDRRWFRRLQRPRWLTFEKVIPVIWTVIFICGAWSAYIVWENNPGSLKSWLLMGCYLLVEIAIIAYTPVMFKLRSLKVGTIIGAIGTILGLCLMLTVFTISVWAGLLLLPYVIWSPIGTYTTWEMMKLNPMDV